MCSHRIRMGTPRLKPAASRWVSEGVKRGLNLPRDLSVSPPERLAGSPCISGCRLGADTGALRVKEKCSVETPSEVFLGFLGNLLPALGVASPSGGAAGLPRCCRQRYWLRVIESIQFGEGSTGLSGALLEALTHAGSDPSLHRICRVWFSWPFLVSWSLLKLFYFNFSPSEVGRRHNCCPCLCPCCLSDAGG